MSDGSLRVAPPVDVAPVLGQVVALAIVGAALVVRLLILPVESGAAHLTFYPAVVACFYLLGFWPGCVAALASALVAYFIFMPPYWSWGPTAGSVANSITFVVVCLLLGYLIERMRKVQGAESLATARLASIIQDQTELVCRMTADRVILFANPAYCRAFGLDAKAIVGRCIGHRAVEEDRPAVVEARDRLSPHHPTTTIEVRTTMAGGRVGWVQANLHGYFDESGKLRELQYVGRETTERKVLEARLLEANVRLREAYDQAPAGYHSLDASGRYRDMNELFESWLGCPREQAIGCLGPLDFTDDEGRALFCSTFPVLRLTGKGGALEYNLISRDGTVRRVSTSAVAVHGEDGSFEQARAVSHDITDLHAARNRLQQALAEQSAITDNELIAILKVRNGLVSWANPGFCALFGYQAEELAGLPVRRLYPDDGAFAAATECMLARFGAHDSFRTQVRMCHRDGRLMWVDLAGSELAGSRGESLWTLVDVTRTHLRLRQEQVEQAAMRDTLTGLANRSQLLPAQAERAMQEAKSGDGDRLRFHGERVTGYA